MVKPVVVAGIFLGIMSIVDTLAYGVRTAGVLTKRLAIALSLFNILVIFSRLSNMIQAPILGNFPDKVFKGFYTPDQVLLALRYDLLFVVGGVLVGAAVTPSFIRVTSRGIDVLNQKGSFMPTLLHGIRKIWRLPNYFRVPSIGMLHHNLDFRQIPIGFLLFNVFVTCFYSIGVMSTILAASWDHSLAVTMTTLSGIVNGIASLLLFTIVDPPAAVVVDQCISGQRPEGHAKIMNIYLVLTRLIGCLLALAMLPPMAHYVKGAAYWIDDVFSASPVDQDVLLAQSTTTANGLKHQFSVAERRGELQFVLEVENVSADDIELTYPSAAKFDFILSSAGQELWRRTEGLRFTQAVESESLASGMTKVFETTVPNSSEIEKALASGLAACTAEHQLLGRPVVISIEIVAAEE